MSLPSDVVIDTTTFGGVVNTACHGTGKTQVSGWSSRCKRGLVFVSHRSTLLQVLRHRKA